MDDGKRYHLFLSHTWNSGQDQVAVIKRKLQLMLPGCQIFLDVDDLDVSPPRIEPRHVAPMPRGLTPSRRHGIYA